MIDLNDPLSAMYFSELVDDGQESGSSEDRPSARDKPSNPPVPAAEGFSYPGPRPILSKPPQFTNYFQTVLQSGMQNPQVLKPPLAVPNIVKLRTADSVPSHTKETYKAAPEEQTASNPYDSKPKEIAPFPNTEPAALTQVPQNSNGPPESLAAIEEMKAAPEKQRIVEPEKTSKVDSITTPTSSGDVLALSPIPALKNSAPIPPGEARGRFAVSPRPNLTGSETIPGFREVRNKNISTPVRRDPPKTVAAGSFRNQPHPGDMIKSSSSSATADANTAGGPKSPDSGTTSNSKQAFAGITILGGEWEPGSDSDSAPIVQAHGPLHTSYDVSIVSTEDSGGGLPFSGIFSHEQIYTVYLDMREAEDDPCPSWTLEFAVSKASPGSAAADNQEGLLLPFPTVKEKPVFPRGLVHRYQGKTIIAYAVVSTSGKMEQISVKESPDPLLNDAVVSALSKWVFRPAKIDGEVAIAKVLIGIPLSLPE